MDKGWNGKKATPANTRISHSCNDIMGPKRRKIGRGSRVGIGSEVRKIRSPKENQGKV